MPLLIFDDFLAWDRSCPKTDCLRPHIADLCQY